MKYMGQRDQYSCGPTALANVMKWAGVRGGAKKWRKHFLEVTGCTPERGGTPPWHLEEGLKTIDEISFQRIEQPSLEDIDGHLDEGGIVLLRVRYKEGGHYFLCTRRTKHKYEVINRKTDHVTKSLVSRDTVQKDLSYVDNFIGGTYHSVAWLIW